MTAAATRSPPVRFLLILSVTLLSAAGGNARAQGEAAFEPAVASSALDELAAQVSADGIDSRLLNAARADAVAIGAAASACYQRATEERGRLEARFEPLKDIDPTVDAAVFDQRTEIQNALNATIQRQTQCAAVRDEAERLVERITDRQTRLSQQFLFAKSDSVVGLLDELPARIAAWPRDIRSAVDLSLDENVSPTVMLWLLAGFGLAAAMAGLLLRHRFGRWFEQAGGMAAEPRLRYFLPRPPARYAPLMLEGLALVAVLYAGLAAPSFDLLVVRVAAGIFLYGLACTVIDWATGPLSPAAGIKGYYPDHVAPLRLRLRIFALTLVASFVVLGTNWLSIRLVDPRVVGRAAMILLVALSLMAVLLYLRRIPGLRHRYRLIRYGGLLTLAAGVICVLVGYQNLAGYLIHGATRTAIALIVLWILLWLVYQAFDFLTQPDSVAATRLRRTLGMPSQSSRSGIGVLQLVADVVLWLVFIVFLIYVWDESGTTLDRLVELITIGIPVGEFTVEPAKILSGILVFAAVIVLIGWMKRWIDSRWLQRIVTERGAREALLTLFGYVGFIIAALLALVQAGVDLSGLAIVSGALALGLGFGLQEIANNFVSGIILLFERPIRAGDFVTVGNIEGFIRRIRIRATEIETLDNQNVLVPNSELVSGRVTNWVLRDPHGRLLIHVGVAYGSDVEKVREILQRVASEHPEVITDGRAPAPRALFMEFGDSSLNFELRVRIQRIERRFSVLSDLNFAIDRAFREEGIRIPFPQRDLHVVSYPDVRPEAPADRKGIDDEVADDADTVRTRILRQEEAVTRSLRQDVSLIASVEDTWEAITDIERLKEWLVEDGEFRPFIGGSYDLVLRDESRMRGRIDIFMPPRRMRLVEAPREQEEPLASGPITIDLILTRGDDEDRTELTVIVAGIPASEDWEIDYRRAEDRWQNALEELKDLLAPE